MSSVTDQIKERIDIVEFISAYINLRKSGRNFVGFCPFHHNVNTPALYVFPATQSYHCFGCKASGTVFDFLMQREGLEFREALEQLARRAGVELRPRTQEDEARDRQTARLLEVNAAAARFFQHVLLKSPRGEAARAYVAHRGLDTATVEAFQLGYAIEEWSALLSYLTDRKGFEPEEVEAAGLAIRRESGGWYDRFRDRLIFPIRNPKGEVIAFGGRALGDAQPKYLNSPETPLFAKSRVLYGLDLARDAIRNENAAVIVEGYVDVLVAHQHGFRNVVAPLGTALTAEHAAALRRLAKRVYLALDADPAGIRATLKGADTLRRSGDGEVVPVPTPQGYIRWEREAETEIRVISLPDGQDPDEVIRANPDRWRALVAGAQPVMDFYTAALTADLDLRSGKGKAEAVARLAPLIAQIANPVEQAHHVQQIARLVGVEESVIRRALPGRGSATRALRPVLPQPAAAPEPGDYLLSWLIRYPAARTAVEEKLRRDLEAFPDVKDIIGGTPLELFDDVETRAAWQAWLAQPAGTDPAAWAQTLDEPLAGFVQRILRLGVPETQSYRYVNDALECATILQRELVKRWKDRLGQQAAEATDDAERADALARLVHLQAYLDALSIPKRSSTFSDLRTTLRSV
jgi:DNA primase